MLVKLSTEKTVSEAAAALQAAVQANHSGRHAASSQPQRNHDEEGRGVRARMSDLRGLLAATSKEGAR